MKKIKGVPILDNKKDIRSLAIMVGIVTVKFQVALKLKMTIRAIW
ncbi:hypothetical protein [Bartonella sp. B17]